MIPKRVTSVLAALCLAGALYTPVATAQGASIKGTVKWTDKPFRLSRMKNMNAECTKFNKGKPPRNPAVSMTKEGMLNNVFVYIENAPKGDYPLPKEAVVLEQLHCMYKPHIFGVRVGQPVEVRNDDPTAHNVHFTPRKNPEFNKSQPKKGLVDTLVFKRAEVMVPVKCDVHPWMSAYAGVMDHPFFAVTKKGEFEIKDVPPGKYTLVAWHEKYGEKKAEVTVTADGATVEFTYKK